MIRADIRRTLKKVSFYIVALIACIIMFTIKKQDTALEQIETIKTAMELLGGAVAPIAVFVFVFGDEIKAGVIHSIIGRGMSRRKIMIAKYFDCLILLFIMMLPLLIIAYIKNGISGLPISQKQSIDLLFSFLFLYVKLAGAMAFATMAFFLTVSVAGGVVTLVTIIMVFSDVLKAIQSKTQIRVYDIYFDGLVEKAQADFMIGSFPWQLIPAILIYIVGGLFLASVFFDRKELDL